MEERMVDWTKPIEAEDGTPLVLAKHGEHFGDNTNPDRDGHYWVMVEGEIEAAFNTHCYSPISAVRHHRLGFIRNRAAVAIDWSAPLEMVDGTPVRVGGGPDRDGDYLCVREDGKPFTGEQMAQGAVGEPVKRPEHDTVTIKRMSTDDALDAYHAIANRFNYADAHIKILRSLGAIKETPAERFTRETGHKATGAVLAALAWAGKIA
jgi:hypothetical protein